MMLIGRMSRDGRLNARVKYDLTDDICLKIQAQVIDLVQYELALLNVVPLYIS
jgi:mitochondrial import receptor subunit TOM40